MRLASCSYFYGKMVDQLWDFYELQVQIEAVMRCHKMCYHTVLLVLVELLINSIKLIRSTYTTLLTDFNISASQLHKLFNFKLSHEIRTFSKPTDIKLHCPSCSIHYIWRIKMVKEETDKLNLSINEIRLNNRIIPSCVSLHDCLPSLPSVVVSRVNPIC